MADKNQRDKIKLVQGWPSQAQVDALVTLFPLNLEPKDDLNAELLEHGGDALDTAILEQVIEPRIADLFVVPGHDLGADHVFVGIVPVWRTEFDRQDKTLSDICRKSIGMGKGMEISSLGFPLLVGGRFGYPKKRAVRIIMNAIADELDDQIEEIQIIDNDPDVLGLFQERLDSF